MLVGDRLLWRSETPVHKRPEYECPGCRGNGVPGLSQGELSLVRCPGCGLIYRKAEDVTKALDANALIFERMPRGWWEGLYDFLNARARGAVLPSLRTPGKALEVGPGRGAFIAFLLKKGYQVEGVDISKNVCDRMKKRFGVRMVNGTIDRLQDGSTFDLIALHHVVEHIPEILAFFGKCRSLLAPRGRLVVSCPNFASWSAAFRSWSGYEPYHCLFFTPDSLAALLERSGFTVIRVSTRQLFTGWWNILFRSAVRGGGPDLGGVDGPQQWGRGIRFLYNAARFFGSVFLLPVTVATARMSRGEEIVAIAVKSGDGPTDPDAGGEADRVSTLR